MAADGGCWNNLPSVILVEVFKYLSKKDTISASTTCKQWRHHLYHASLWKSVTFVIDSHDEDTIARNRYLASCFAKKLRNATIRFNSLDAVCLEEAARIVKKLSKNQDLQKFHLIPSNGRFEAPGGCEGQKQFLESRGLQMLHKIASNSRRLVEFNLGCMEDMTSYSKELLNLLVLNQASSLRVLGLASLKDDPDDYLLPDIDGSRFQNFRHLQILSLDYDNVDDRLLLALNGPLERLVIHVHGIAETHPHTRNEAWETFKINNPKCELRLSLIHSYDAVEILHNTVLQPSMPLTHIRVFFCEQINVTALENLSIWFPRSLRSIQWVDSLQCSASNALLDLSDIPESTDPNPIIMLAWRCVFLEEIVLYGYKMWESEVTAVIRLQKNLQRFDIWDGDILLERSDTMEKMEQALSRELGRPWKPKDTLQIDEVIRNPHNGDSDEYILPWVASDLTL